MHAYGRVGTGAFTLIVAARPRSGQSRAGKKDGVLGRNFCPPAAISGGVPAAPAARQSVNFVQNRFGFGCINAPVSNFRLFGRAFRRRFAPPYTGKLARRARRGSPNRGSKSLAILSICFALLKTNNINL